MDHADAVSYRFAGVREFHWRSVDEDLAFVGVQ